MSKRIRIIEESLTTEEKKSFEKWKKAKGIPKRLDFFDMYLWAKAKNQRRILGLLELASMLDAR